MTQTKSASNGVRSKEQSKEVLMLEGSGAASTWLQHTCPVFAIEVIYKVRLFLGWKFG